MAVLGSAVAAVPGPERRRSRGSKAWRASIFGLGWQCSDGDLPLEGFAETEEGVAHAVETVSGGMPSWDGLDIR